MKKLAFLFLTAVLASCSSDEKTGTENNSNTLPLKIVFTYPEGAYNGRTTTYTFTYNGTKLDKVVQLIEYDNITTQSYLEYQYTGDFISHVKRTSNTNIETDYEYLYNTETGKLVSETATSSGITPQITSYTYSTEGNYDIATASFNYGTHLKKYIFENNNQLKEQAVNGATVTDVFNCSYDANKNPFNQITGLNKLLVKDLFFTDIDGRIVLHTGANNINQFSWSNAVFYNCEYQYNSQGYPVSAYIDDIQVDYFYE